MLVGSLGGSVAAVGGQTVISAAGHFSNHAAQIGAASAGGALISGTNGALGCLMNNICNKGKIK